MGLGKVQEVKVSFDRGIDGNVPVYFSGEVVTGKVTLVLSGETKVKYLEICAKGKAKVQWTDTRDTGRRRDENVTYYNEAEYLNVKCILLGQEQEDVLAEKGPIILSPGTYDYAFSIQLPGSSLVPTFKGEYGSVKYYIKAELHRPWHLASTSSSDFTIFQHVDISTPDLMSPQMGSKDKTICCCCCASGPISLNVKLEKKGFASGESIRIIADVENHSSRKVVPKVSIIQIQSYYARGQSKEVKETVAQVEGEAISGGSMQTWNGNLLVLSLTPSIFNCNILTVDYALKVYLSISGAMNLSIEFPIVIGSPPIRPPDYPKQPIGFVYN